MKKDPAKRSFFQKPATPEEKAAGLALYFSAQKHNLQRPRFVDQNGDVWVYESKGKGDIRLIRYDLKLERNAARKASKLNQSVTLEDFETAWPGQGQQLYEEELRRTQEIYKNRQEGEDIDHIWSLNDGGLHASRNLRPLNSIINRAEGDRGAPDPEIQNATGNYSNKMDYLRWQGPDLPSGKTIQIVRKAGQVSLKLVDNMIDSTLDAVYTVGHLQGMDPQEVDDVMKSTVQKREDMAKIARSQGGIGGTPDFGFTESFFGKSFVNDERQSL